MADPCRPRGCDAGCRTTGPGSNTKDGARDFSHFEDPNGLWTGSACFPGDFRFDEAGQPWTATMHTRQTLQILDLDPTSESARRAVALVAENGRWEHDAQRYLTERLNRNINGRTTETGSYFGVDVAPIVERILT